jgi:Uncharacterized protein conserved in bacteria (DUF2188)
MERNEMPKAKQHVVPSQRGGWAVRRSGASRASRVFETQRDAVSYARHVARKEGAALYIHDRDGTIRHRDTYGPDPISPRSKD